VIDNQKFCNSDICTAADCGKPLRLTACVAGPQLEKRAGGLKEAHERERVAIYLCFCRLFVRTLGNFAVRRRVSVIQRRLVDNRARRWLGGEALCGVQLSVSRAGDAGGVIRETRTEDVKQGRH